MWKKKIKSLQSFYIILLIVLCNPFKASEERQQQSVQEIIQVFNRGGGYLGLPLLPSSISSASRRNSIPTGKPDARADHPVKDDQPELCTFAEKLAFFRQASSQRRLSSSSSSNCIGVSNEHGDGIMTDLQEPDRSDVRADDKLITRIGQDEFKERRKSYESQRRASSSSLIVRRRSLKKEERSRAHSNPPFARYLSLASTDISDRVIRLNANLAALDISSSSSSYGGVSNEEADRIKKSLKSLKKSLDDIIRHSHSTKYGSSVGTYMSDRTITSDIHLAGVSNEEADRIIRRMESVTENVANALNSMLYAKDNQDLTGILEDLDFILSHKDRLKQKLTEDKSLADEYYREINELEESLSNIRILPDLEKLNIYLSDTRRSRVKHIQYQLLENAAYYRDCNSNDWIERHSQRLDWSLETAKNLIKDQNVSESDKDLLRQYILIQEDYLRKDLKRLFEQTTQDCSHTNLLDILDVLKCSLLGDVCLIKVAKNIYHRDLFDKALVEWFEEETMFSERWLGIQKKGPSSQLRTRSQEDENVGDVLAVIESASSTTQLSNPDDEKEHTSCSSWLEPVGKTLNIISRWIYPTSDEVDKKPSAKNVNIVITPHGYEVIAKKRGDIFRRRRYHESSDKNLKISITPYGDRVIASSYHQPTELSELVNQVQAKPSNTLAIRKSPLQERYVELVEPYFKNLKQWLVEKLFREGKSDLTKGSFPIWINLFQNNELVSKSYLSQYAKWVWNIVVKLSSMIDLDLNHLQQSDDIGLRINNDGVDGSEGEEVDSVATIESIPSPTIRFLSSRDRVGKRKLEHNDFAGTKKHRITAHETQKETLEDSVDIIKSQDIETKQLPWNLLPSSLNNHLPKPRAKVDDKSEELDQSTPNLAEATQVHLSSSIVPSQQHSQASLDMYLTAYLDIAQRLMNIMQRSMDAVRFICAQMGNLSPQSAIQQQQSHRLPTIPEEDEDSESVNSCNTPRADSAPALLETILDDVRDELASPAQNEIVAKRPTTDGYEPLVFSPAAVHESARVEEIVQSEEPKVEDSNLKKESHYHIIEDRSNAFYESPNIGSGIILKGKVVKIIKLDFSELKRLKELGKSIFNDPLFDSAAFILEVFDPKKIDNKPHEKK